MNKITMYQRIFDICLEAYGNAKFNKLYNTGNKNIQMHNEEIKYRENKVVEAFLDLKEAEKALSLTKGAV